MIFLQKCAAIPFGSSTLAAAASLAVATASSAAAGGLPAPREAPLVPDVQHCSGSQCPSIGPGPARLFGQIHLYTPDRVPFGNDRRRRPANYMTDLVQAVNAVADNGTIFVHDGDHRFTTAAVLTTPKNFTLKAQPGDENYASLRTSRRKCLALTPWAEPRRAASDLTADPNGPAAGMALAVVRIENLIINAGVDGAEGDACIRAQGVSVWIKNVKIGVSAPDAIAVDLMSGPHRLVDTEIISEQRGSSIGVRVGARSDVELLGRSRVSNFMIGVSVNGRVQAKTALFSNNDVSIAFGGDLPVTPLPASPKSFTSTIDGSAFYIGHDEIGIDVASSFGGAVSASGVRFNADAQDYGGTGVRIASRGQADVAIRAGASASALSEFVGLAVGVDAAGPVDISGGAFIRNATALRLGLANARTPTRVVESVFDALPNAKLFVFPQVAGGRFEFSGNQIAGNGRLPKDPFDAGGVARSAECRSDGPNTKFDEKLWSWTTRKRVCLRGR